MVNSIPNYDLSSLLGSPCQTTLINPTPISSTIKVLSTIANSYQSMQVSTHVYQPDTVLDSAVDIISDPTDSWLFTFFYDSLVFTDICHTTLELTAMKQQHFWDYMKNFDVFNDPIVSPKVYLCDLCFSHQAGLTDEEEEMPEILLPSSYQKVQTFELKHWHQVIPNVLTQINCTLS